jgi:hypothetical protein
MSIRDPPQSLSGATASLSVTRLDQDAQDPFPAAPLLDGDEVGSEEHGTAGQPPVRWGGQHLA